MNFSAPLALPSGFTLPSRVILSPMEGVMTPPFVRAANLLKLTDLWLTPFLSVTGSVPSPSVLRKRLLPYTESGLPVIVQLIGRDPDALTECAVSLEQSGIRAVNLNLACPSPTVTAHGAGGALLRDPERVRAIVRTVRNALKSTTSLSVKLRTGYSNVDLARLIGAVEGAEFILLHHRTVQENYRSVPDGWKRLSEAVRLSPVPVFGNGDIASPDDAVRMVGQNISYSPHCREAMKRGESCLISVGSITGVPSIFAARRIDDVDGKPLGVLCAREDFGFMFTKFADVYVALLSPDNMVFMTNEKHFSAHTPFWARERKGIRENAEQLNGCYLDGILYAERACNFLTVPGWRVVLGLPTQLPLWAYIAGEILVVLLWLLPLMIFSLFVLHYRMRHGFAVSLNWRKTVFNNNASGIFVTDSQCRLADSNRTFSLFSGYTVEELRKMKLFDLCPNTGSEKEELSDFVFSSRAHYENFEFRICRKNGVLTTVSLAGNRIHTARMNPHLPSDGVIWTVTDLSAPMGELDRLRKEEERFRALVENSTEQVALLDPQGTILYSNDREIAFLLRKSPTPVHLSELYDPATTSLFLKMIQNVISSRRPLTFRYTRKTPGTPEEEMLSLFFPIPREGAVQQIGVVTRKFESEPGNPEKH